MFDDVHFTGTVNLGNLILAVVNLLTAITVFYRVKAELAKHEQKTGETIKTSLVKRLPRSLRRKKKLTTGDGEKAESAPKERLK